MGALKFFGSLVFATSFLFGAASIANSQQPQTQPASERSLGQQAVDLVLQHYGINPDGVVPGTGKPLPLNGKWAIDKNPPESCPHITGPCLRVFYVVSGTGVSCEWTVLLGGETDKNFILDINEDTARYMMIRPEPVHKTTGTTSHSQPRPIYPPLAKMARIEGTVVMVVHINETGHVDNVTVVSGPPELRKAAVEAVQTWAYNPVIVDSTPIAIRSVVYVNFRLGR
jgi:TonB family protein